MPIYTTSPNAQILHNTALTRGRYPNAVEVRFAGATNVVVQNNLLDAAVTGRDGAVPTTSNNLTSAVPAWFAGEAAGDLHLRPAATAAIDQVTRLAGASDDFDGGLRPAGAGQADLGADELGVGPQIFSDGFETGDTSAWSLVVP